MEYEQQPIGTAIVADGTGRRDGWPWRAEVVRTTSDLWEVYAEFSSDPAAAIDAFRMRRGFTKARYVVEFLETL